MATLQEILSGLGKGVEAGFNDPMTQLGLQMMQAGGYQQQPMTFGQRLAQAGTGFLDQRAQAQQLELQKQLRQAQMIKAQSDADEARRLEASRSAVRNAVQMNPDLFKDNPLAGIILGQTGDPSQLSGLSAMMPKQGSTPFQYDRHNPDGTITQMIRNQSGGYDVGATFTPTAQQNIYLGRDRLEQQGGQFTTRLEEDQRQFDIGQDYRERQFDYTRGKDDQQFQFGVDKQLAEQEFRNRQLAQNQTQFEDTKQLQRDKALQDEQFRRDQLAQQERSQSADRQVKIAAENRKSLETAQNRSMKREQFQAESTAAMNQMDDAVKRANELLEHKGLERSFGVYSKLPTVPGSDSADFQAKLDSFKELLSLRELQRLKEGGMSLAPVTESERDAAGKSVVGLQYTQSASQAREQLQRARDILQQTRTEMGMKFKELDSAYDTSTPTAAPTTPAQPAAPANLPSYDQAVQEANQALQQRPDLRDAINQRLMERYGRGL